MVDIHVSDLRGVKRRIGMLEMEGRGRNDIFVDASYCKQNLYLPIYKTYQPKKRTFWPCAQFGKSLRSTRVEGIGPDMVLWIAGTVGGYFRLRCQATHVPAAQLAQSTS
jgi:hypothetical protein